MWNYNSDVLVLILIRVPAKFLGRCKCVCKPWKVLISSSEFIRLHLQYQSSIQKTLHTLLQSREELGLAEYSFNVAWDSGNLEGSCEIQPLYNPNNNWWMLVGSSDGLLCQIQFEYAKAKLHKIYGEYEISLCNPITKSTWVLPKIPALLLKDEISSRRVGFHGFGYDDVHDTYKVFLASASLDEPKYASHNNRHSQTDADYEYLVFHLRSNEWVKVTSSFHDFSNYYIHCPRWNLHGVLVNNALHWIFRNPYGHSHNKHKNYVLAFDLITDQLDILAPLPDATEGDDDDLILSVVNGCLLLINHNIVFGPEGIVDMWVMKDYGLKDSWTRIHIHNSPHHLCTIAPMALLEVEDNGNNNHHRKGKLIYHDVRLSREIKLLSYDLESNQVVMLPPSPSILYYGDPIPLQYVASLVQPHPPLNN